MRSLRFVRLLTVALVLAGGVLFPALATSVSANTRGSVVIHARFCRTTVGSANVFAECHDNPRVGDYFRIDNRQPKPTDVNGNVSFGRATAGDHFIQLTSGYDSGQFSHFKAFCSNIRAGTGPNEARVYNDGEYPYFYGRLGAGDQLVCDFYYIP